MELNIGDEVFVIDEDLTGEVIDIDSDVITIESEDGFEYQYQKNQLLKIGEDKKVEFQRKEFQLSKNRETQQKSISYSINLKGEKSVIDLHMEELAPNLKFQNQHEALLFQLDFVKETLIIASRKRIRRLVFVHGVGKGRLRAELRKMLTEKYPTIEYFDGSYLQFGDGATEIIIHQF